MPKQVFGTEYYTVPEAAIRLGVSRMTVLRWVSDEQHTMHGKIRAFKHPLSGHHYLDIKVVDRLAVKTLAATSSTNGRPPLALSRALRTA